MRGAVRGLKAYRRNRRTQVLYKSFCLHPTEVPYQTRVGVMNKRVCGRGHNRNSLEKGKRAQRKGTCASQLCIEAHRQGGDLLSRKMRHPILKYNDLPFNGAAFNVAMVAAVATIVTTTVSNIEWKQTNQAVSQCHTIDEGQYNCDKLINMAMNGYNDWKNDRNVVKNDVV
jgi:hypothetical protein